MTRLATTPVVPAAAWCAAAASASPGSDVAKPYPPPPWQWMSISPGRMTPAGGGAAPLAAATRVITPASTVTTPSVSPAVGIAPLMSTTQG